MTRENQKREELLLVETMRRLLGGVPAGVLEPADEPDVRAVSSTGRVGIEVTELHQRPTRSETPRRLQESERAGVVSRARAAAEAAGLPVVDVAVHFNDSVPIAKGNRGQIIDALVALVSNNMPEVDGSVELEIWRQFPDPLPWFRTVRLFRAAVLTKHHWAVPDSGWVQTDFIDELQEAIDEKNARHARYSRHCDECWLLVTASGGRPSGLFELSNETRSHVYRSAFTRTFFMEVFGENLVELNTMAAKPAHAPDGAPRKNK